MDLECEICYCPFDEEETRPRVLPCAHSYCESCIDNNINKERKTCPACREPFSTDTAKDLPSNYALEKLLQKISLIVDRPEKEQIGEFNLGICPKHKHNRLDLVCKFEYGTHPSGPICKDCKVLDHRHCKPISVEENIKELKKSRIEDANKFIKTSEIRIDGLKLFTERVSDKIRIKEGLIQSLLEEMEKLNEEKSREEQVESLLIGNMNALKDSQNQLETSSTKKEMAEACRDVLNKIHEVENHTHDIDEKYDINIEFGQELLALKPANFIQEMIQLEDPKVWAVAEIDEAVYGAEVFINDNEVFMEALIKENNPPDDYVTVSAFRLLSLLPEKNPKVYMTLSLNEETLGNVIITILPCIKSGYGRQFLTLFSGSLGPSYRGLNMSNKTDRTLSVYSYVKPDGTKDSVPIVPDYSYGSITYSKMKGSVFNCGKGGFTIFHKDEGGAYNTKYGTVTRGMEVIQNIVDNESWEHVKIDDLGVVLGCGTKRRKGTCSLL